MTDAERDTAATFQHPSDTREPACWSWPIPSDPVEVDWDDLYDWHADRCAVCGKRSVDLVTDHDHWTGLVRGMLCRGCNAAEGGASGEGLYARYRERYPAAILGIELEYVSPFRHSARSARPDPDLDRSPAYAVAQALADEDRTV